MLLPDYTVLFTDQSPCTLQGHRPAMIHLSDSVDLNLPTGRVVICDPFAGLGPFAPRPFTSEVNPGRYSITLAFVSFDHGGTEGRVAAAARLSISDAPVTSWELGITQGRTVSDLGDDEYLGYETGDGSVCFVDGSAVSRLDQYEERLDTALTSFAQAQFDHAPVKLTGATGDEVVAFYTSRPAPDVYPTWIGRTADGDIACFVTDFLVVVEPSLSDPPPHAHWSGALVR